MTVGCFHKSFTHFGTIWKIYPWKTDWSQKGPDFSYLPHLRRRSWNKYMMDIWVLRNACSKQGNLYSGQAFPVTSVRLWKNLEFVKQVPNLLILSYRLKHSHGTMKEKSVHILQTPSIWWMWSQCCLLHKWGVWHHLQPEIGQQSWDGNWSYHFYRGTPSLLRVEFQWVFL